VLKYLALLSTYLTAEQTDLASVQTEFNFLPVSAYDLYFYENGILANGLPDAAQLVSEGFDPLDLSLAQHVISEQDIYAVAAISTNGLGDPGFLSPLGSASDALTNLANTTVPEPGTVFLFGIGLLGFAVIRIRSGSLSGRTEL
jgi:hypothetical protein